MTAPVPGDTPGNEPTPDAIANPLPQDQTPPPAPPATPVAPGYIFQNAFADDWDGAHYHWPTMQLAVAGSGDELYLHATATTAWDAVSFAHLDEHGAVSALPADLDTALSFVAWGSGTLKVRAENGSSEYDLTLTATPTAYLLRSPDFNSAAASFTQLTFKATADHQSFYLDDVWFGARPHDGGGEQPPANATPRISGGGLTEGSDGCATSEPTGDVQLDLTILGKARTAIVSVPTSYDHTKAYPIVFAFHGCGDVMTNAHTYLVSHTQTQGKAIIVYPQALSANGKCWYDGFAGSNGDLEAQLFLEMRAHVRNHYCTDMKRTFVTGFSQGGLLSHNLACRFGTDEVTAFAPNAGSLNAARFFPASAYVYDDTFYPDEFNGPFNTQASAGAYKNSAKEFMCPVDGAAGTVPTPKPKLPPPVIIFHGDDDWTGDVSIPRGREAARHWAYAARCTEDPVQLSIDQNDDNNSNPCAKPTCAVGHEVEYCEIRGMQHAVWDLQHGTPRAPTLIWQFFSKY